MAKDSQTKALEPGSEKREANERADQGTHACIHDLPQVRLVVREYQVEGMSCPACQNSNVDSFPQGVEAPRK